MLVIPLSILYPARAALLTRKQWIAHQCHDIWVEPAKQIEATICGNLRAQRMTDRTLQSLLQIFDKPRQYSAVHPVTVGLRKFCLRPNESSRLAPKREPMAEEAHIPVAPLKRRYKTRLPAPHTTAEHRV